MRARPKRAGTDITVAGRGSRRLSRPLCKRVLRDSAHSSFFSTGGEQDKNTPVVSSQHGSSSPKPTASTRIAMEGWVRAVVEAIHSSRSQAVIYLAGGASQVSVPAPPVILPSNRPDSNCSALPFGAGARLAPVRARRVGHRPRGRRSLLQGLYGAAPWQGNGIGTPGTLRASACEPTVKQPLSCYC